MVNEEKVAEYLSNLIKSIEKITIENKRLATIDEICEDLGFERKDFLSIYNQQIAQLDIIKMKQHYSIGNGRYVTAFYITPEARNLTENYDKLKEIYNQNNILTK
ncbi:MAG: hypothetical protein J7K26_01130 [Candidatus Aenigmarchaeota archaeon]|nr:hypothetical protein [Candidatus Aenigmarchaeota archaeon]